MKRLTLILAGLTCLPMVGFGATSCATGGVYWMKPYVRNSEVPDES